MTKRYRAGYCRAAICSPAFVDDHCYDFYERRLLSRLSAFRVALSAYCLLPNAVYLLAATDSPFGLVRLLCDLNADYALYFNNRFDRVGAVWRADCRQLDVPGGQTLLDVHKFVERRPLASLGCEDPGQHPWSSYHLNAFGRDERLNSFTALNRLRGAPRGSFARYRSFIACGFAAGYEDWLLRQVERGGDLRAVEALSGSRKLARDKARLDLRPALSPEGFKVGTVCRYS